MLLFFGILLIVWIICQTACTICAAVCMTRLEVAKMSKDEETPIPHVEMGDFGDLFSAREIKG